jgi:hypothetical protein
MITKLVLKHHNFSEGKAQFDSKAERTHKYVSILNRIGTQPARHREPLRRGGRVIGKIVVILNQF